MFHFWACFALGETDVKQMSAFNTDKTFVTSDTHFGHGVLARNRGFDTQWQMDKELIWRWNETVPAGSTVWHLGDLGMRCSPAYLKGVLDQLNGRIHILWGNHDQTAKKLLACFAEYDNVKEIKLKNTGSPLERKGHPLKIWMSHYSHRVWPSSHHGSVHLYGHSHGNLPPEGRSLDVGVDCHDLRPISFREALDKIWEAERMRKR